MNHSRSPSIQRLTAGLLVALGAVCMLFWWWWELSPTVRLFGGIATAIAGTVAAGVLRQHGVGKPIIIGFGGVAILGLALAVVLLVL